MPIPTDEFEQTPDTHGRGRDQTHVESVRRFLADHPEEAFTLREIRQATDVPQGCVGSALARLADAGHVRHRGQYWATVPAPDRT
jgi:DNA-binding GntR family transcriptional regulator